MEIRRRTSLMILVIAALLLLLPLLAVLQYRWLGEVSQAERERMQSNLRASAEKLCADFDSELTNLYVQFQLPALPNSELVNLNVASRYRLWVASSPKSKLISEIYRVVSNDEGKWRLTKFQPESSSFEEVEWPEKLSSIRERFESDLTTEVSTQNLLRGFFKPNGELPNLPMSKTTRSVILQVSPGLTAAEIPALIIPDMTAPGADFQALLKGKRACTIAVLDADAIKKEIVSPLINRYFSVNGANEYNLAIISRGNPTTAIYQTDPNLPLKAFERPDARDSLFRVRGEELNRIFLSGSLLSSSPAPTEAASSPAIGDEKNKNSSSRVAIKVLQSEVQVAKSGSSPSSVNHPQRVEIHRPFTSPLDVEGDWQLLVKHRAGSLDAAVANVRRRNLTISFGILLLLGVSVGFIVLSSRRAERLAKQQMEFVAGVSHELRTPLAVICSAAENLADGVIDSRDQIKRYGGLIRDEGRRLAGMVEQVLEFAGAQSGRKTYDLRPTDLNHVIEDAIAACHLQLVEGGFELEKAIPADLPMVNADAAALSRAIQNLLSNAMKYSGESCWIGLSVETVNTDSGKEIQIKISDRGLGIQPSELPHIFEPFYRGKDVVASQIHGNGLGLSLVKHIASAHQGQVNVGSVWCKGSQFILILPLINTQEISPEIAKDIYDQAHPAR
ncbi:MAG: HAMP domain-containing histidine kinase [Acidobacteria bacterium]|nr:HAMP domain-containing histidine kinase [Acidobacteriota bacterium]